jgi:hypothetical protein
VVFRWRCNQITRELIQDECRLSDERLKVIDKFTWSNYLNKIRRDLIKRDLLVQSAIGDGPGADGTSEEVLAVIDLEIRKIMEKDENEPLSSSSEEINKVFQIIVDQSIIDLADIFQVCNLNCDRNCVTLR